MHSYLHNTTYLLWLFSDVESRPWDFQAEECSLRCAVDQFNHRRYQRELPSGAQQMQQSQEKSVNETYGPEVKNRKKNFILLWKHKFYEKILVVDSSVYLFGTKLLSYSFIMFLYKFSHHTIFIKNQIKTQWSLNLYANLIKSHKPFVSKIWVVNSRSWYFQCKLRFWAIKSIFSSI